MISVFRRVLMASKSLPNVTESTYSCWKSQKLRTLAQQLRLYKPLFGFGEEDQEKEEEIRGAGVVSQMGFVESSSPISLPKEKRRTAAVLVCLFENDSGDLRVILTKRSSNLSTHSGEVSLPGGKSEEGDADDSATALREAREEIGLDPKLVTVVSVLEPFLSKHLLRVVPVIGILPDNQSFNPEANAAEVEAIFDAPLEMFLKDENKRWEEREWLGSKYLIHYFDFESEKGKFLIWGLTAGILIRTASVVYQRPPAFQEQIPDFQRIHISANKGNSVL